LDLLREAADKHLYEVSIEEKDILHRGDLRIYDAIGDALRNGQPVSDLAREFWQGARWPNPRVELAASKIRVKRKIRDKAPRQLGKGPAEAPKDESGQD